MSSVSADELLGLVTERESAQKAAEKTAKRRSINENFGFDKVQIISKNMFSLDAWTQAVVGL